MKKLFLLMFIVSTTGFNIHAAAGPPAEINSEMLDFAEKADEAMIADDLSTFASLFELHRKLIDFSHDGYDFNMTSVAILREKPHFLSFLIEITKEINPYHLNRLFQNTECSICRNLDDRTFDIRMEMLKGVFEQIKTKPLQSSAITETIKTPQQWMQQKARDILESDECTACTTPWPYHTAIKHDRITQLRKALQLDYLKK